MGWIGTGEIILILFLALVLFGPQKLPELGRFLGSTLREVQKMSRLDIDALERLGEEEDKKIGEEKNNEKIPEPLTPSKDVVEPDFKESNYPLERNSEDQGEPPSVTGSTSAG